jgi:hypothetical protein
VAVTVTAFSVVVGMTVVIVTHGIC